ncbi:hypothetical protein DIS24_g10755 [Lasiodiplodia hormozganensis]|uniref:Uncharacterized protein n=1 Tax=Lasiodiplodia hormozganensis TaxID=869390 RepID=A0AA40CGL3_9PEZI|nr:hypothetical protein DIS24_g10755 [Lasiodiplodia hormozganensis]
MDDNDEEGDYNSDFYAKLPEGAEEPRLPIFQNFSFQANPAVEAGSSTGQQPTQADGSQQNPQSEPDDVNDNSVPVLGDDEDQNEENDVDNDGEKDEEEEDDEEEEEEEAASGAQDDDVGQIVQEWRNNVMRDAQQQGAGQGQQPTTAVLLQYAANHPAANQRERRRQLKAARTIAERNDQDGRVSLWLGNSPHIQGPAPQEYAQQAMSDTAWDQRYGQMTAAERLAHDIPVPRGQPPVEQRTRRRYWRKLDLIRRGKRKVEEDDDDSDYESVDENSIQYRSYIPEQAYLTRNNLPFLMGVREVEHHKHPPSDPTEVPLLYDQNGQPVLGFQGKHLRDLPILPRRIPAGVPGWLVEVWMRYDRRVKIADLKARIWKSVGRVTKRGTDYREHTAGLFHAYTRDNKFEEKEAERGKDVIDAIKSDCQAADIIDPLGDGSETDAQKRERTDNAAQKIFRNTVWNLTRDHNGAVNGIQQG